jgi:hypothetical protein
MAGDREGSAHRNAVILAMIGGNVLLSSSMSKLRAIQVEKLRLDGRALRFRHHWDGEHNLGENRIEKAAFLDVFTWLSMRGSLRPALWSVKVKDVAQDRRGITEMKRPF